MICSALRGGKLLKKGKINVIATLISVFTMKFADCSLGVLKTVFLVKNKFFISSVLNSMSAALFIFVADAMANAPSEAKMSIAAVVFLANLAGGYFPPKLVDKMEKDRLFIYAITAPTFKDGAELADDLRRHNIPVSTTVVYGKEIEKTLAINAYAVTRDESRIISRHLTDEYKWHIMEAI